MSPDGGSPERVEGHVRAFRPGIEADVAHQMRRQVARHATRNAAAVPGTFAKITKVSWVFLSGDETEGGTQLRGQILARSVDEASAGFADDEGRDGPDLKRSGVLTVGLDGLRGFRVVEDLGKGRSLEA